MNNTNTILLCHPKHFDVTYSINPWMTTEAVDKALAIQQWEELKVIIHNIGVTTKQIEPCLELPDMVFTANAGIVRNKSVVLSNFKYPERRKEKDKFKEWFLENDYMVHELDESLIFEGAGDCVVKGDTLISGYGFRTEFQANKQTAELLNLDLINIRLVNENFYHLDTCFSVISNDLGIYFPDAFEDKNLANTLQMELIEVSKTEAYKFACNSIVYNKYVIVPEGSNNITAALAVRGYTVIEVCMSEFLKSGGAAQCLALWI
tara:strand:- start:180 stop:968 length:789 start_codon:yes stop_codon:yes gene_type:complete